MIQIKEKELVSADRIVKMGQEIFDKEISALEKVKHQLNDSLFHAAQLILSSNGKVIVVGVGKSGLVGRKISASLSSLGTPSYFLHPTEARHGDLGMVANEDVIIAISYSGESSELIDLLPNFKYRGNKIICITANRNSALGTSSDIVLTANVDSEACYLNLAPTSSTTATLVIGDALAIILAYLRGYTSQDFSMNHPSGALGKRLSLLVDDIMNSDVDTVNINECCLIQEALFKMTKSRMGAVNIINNENKLVGIVTDGDIRRNLSITSINTNIGEIKNENCKTILSGTLAIEALEILINHKISILPVVNYNNNPIGLLHIQDLLRAGIK